MLPPLPPTVRAGVVFSAVLGTILRFATLAAWPAPGQALTATLVIVTLACLALGAVATTSTLLRAGTSVLVGFIGSFASVSILASIAIGSSPVMCAAYVVVTPLCAIAGVGIGLLIGTRRPGRVHVVVDHA